jgi:hypothetical protein
MGFGSAILGVSQAKDGLHSWESLVRLFGCPPWKVGNPNSNKLEVLLERDFVAGSQFWKKEREGDWLEEHTVCNVNVEKQTTGGGSDTLEISTQSFETAREVSNVMRVFLAVVNREVSVLTN